MARNLVSALDQPRNWTVRKARLNKVLKAIKENPEYHDQSMWHCGTSHCFAGTAQLIARGFPITTYVGEDYDNKKIRRLCSIAKIRALNGDEGGLSYYFASDDAQRWLGLTQDEADLLFNSENDLSDLTDIVRLLSDKKSVPLRQYLEEYDEETY